MILHHSQYSPPLYCSFLFHIFLPFFGFLFRRPFLKKKKLWMFNDDRFILTSLWIIEMVEKKQREYLKVRPVGGHARPVGVFPPAKVLLLVDGHQCVVELIVHGSHTKRRAVNEWENPRLDFNLLAVAHSESKGRILAGRSEDCLNWSVAPLINTMCFLPPVASGELLVILTDRYFSVIKS